jgi:hypothetical protein
MMSDPDDHPRKLLDLDSDECWSLAATQPIGRLAWTGPDGPTVVPVNFDLTGRSVHVRTAAYSVLARECDDSIVAFEVDSFDAGARTGWSVLFRGRARLVYGHPAPGSEGEPDVWPAGARALRVDIDVEHVSGRRVR